MPLPDKVCPHCGRVFTPKTPGQEYHSPRCRKNEHGSRRRYFPRFGADAVLRRVFRTEKVSFKQLKREVSNVTKR